MVVHVDRVTIATLLPRPGQEVCQQGFRWRQTVSDRAGGYRNRLVLVITDDDPEPHLSGFPTEAVALELKDRHREAAVTFVSRPKVKGHVLPAVTEEHISFTYMVQSVRAEKVPTFHP